MTINNNAGLFESGTWNENNLNPLSRINWRASLVPAAAVIPAPIAYTKVVAVKKLVVGFLVVESVLLRKKCVCDSCPSSGRKSLAFGCRGCTFRHLL